MSAVWWHYGQSATGPGDVMEKSADAGAKAHRLLMEVKVVDGCKAVGDAGLEISDIDGLVTSPIFPSLGSHKSKAGVSVATTNLVGARQGITPRRRPSNGSWARARLSGPFHTRAEWSCIARNPTNAFPVDQDRHFRQARARSSSPQLGGEPMVVRYMIRV